MKLRSTSKRKPRIVMDGSTLYSWEEVFAKAEGHARVDGCIYTLVVEFENETFPVSHMSELPLICKMATAYHNAIVRERLGPEYNNACDQDSKVESTQDEEEYAMVNDIQSSTEDCNTCETQACKGQHEKTEPDCDDDLDWEWDEELFGDQRVYDRYFEINAHLVPWNHNTPKYRTNKYGMYI